MQNQQQLNEYVSLRSMLHDFYNRNMLSVIILTWFWFLVILVLAIFSGVKFFQSEQTRDQILYAAIFIIAIQWVGLMKIFGWEMINRNSIKRDIKKLELKIEELNAKIGK